MTEPKLTRAAWWALAVVLALAVVKGAFGEGLSREVLVVVPAIVLLLIVITGGRPTQAVKSEYLSGFADEDARARHDSRARRYALVWALIWIPATFAWLWHTTPID